MANKPTWDSRPEQPDKTEWALLFGVLVLIAIQIIWGLMS